MLLALVGVGIIVISKNIIHAAYALALTLISVAGIYVLLSAELLAVVQIMLYAGGVVILLVFGVMMTNRLRGEDVVSGSRNRLVSAIISLALFLFFVFTISNTDFNDSQVHDSDQIDKIGISFLTDHIVAFELVAFVLLVALVGASYLAKMASDE
ncbi:NADH-quinone oxidoreductase subunit J family protein [Ekhidna sp.]